MTLLKSAFASARRVSQRARTHSRSMSNTAAEHRGDASASRMSASVVSAVEWSCGIRTTATLATASCFASGMASRLVMSSIAEKTCEEKSGCRAKAKSAVEMERRSAR